MPIVVPLLSNGEYKRGIATFMPYENTPDPQLALSLLITASNANLINVAQPLSPKTPVSIFK